MKKLIFFCLPLLFFVTFFQAQQSVVIRYEYAPNSEYVMKTTSNTDGLMLFRGDKEFEKLLKKSGQPTEMKISNQNSMNVNVKTLEKNGDKTPFIFSYTEVRDNGMINGKPVPKIYNLDGLKIFGNYVNGNKPEIDRFEGGNLDEATKKILMSAISQMSKYVDFPTTPLKPGDSFDQTMPFSFPVAGVGNIEMTIHINYLLKSIDGKDAHFDLVQDLTLNTTKIADYKISGKGNGKGNCVFDTGRNFLSSMNNETDISVAVEIPGENVTIENKAKSKTNLITEKIK